MSFTTSKSPFLTPDIELPEFVLPAVLPDDIGVLKSLLQAQQDAMGAIRQQAMREAHNYIIRMIEQSVLARHRLFGVSSEQLSAQGRLFDEAEALAQSTKEAQDCCRWPKIDPPTRGMLIEN